jgi:hypothetical protein
MRRTIRFQVKGLINAYRKLAFHQRAPYLVRDLSGHKFIEEFEESA